ncbi:Tuliposide A-converting enzyme 1, chloroplastic [Dichanthelium oligosanthes]|uniref:Tuliposide A-converting enzyme 1, chloroplastic n=1 Tax=Dichanthelium oligosanthes TaxID=888268 RepID=A0A1E5VXG8_9POAL|nr:Tuliposide A-converting enzyme 1, chloroplastic [Dichanthelium oligosanthes]
MASNSGFPIPPPADPSDEVVREFGPLLRIYKSGRIERPLVPPPVGPGHDAATGVDSKDVHLGAYSVRLYLPPAAAAAEGGASKKLPVVVYVHGGGFVAESAASPHYHRFLNELAAACPALCVSVEYRLAPEHPLPAGYEDCLAALKWALSAADPWVAAHGDLARVFVAGDSAGANACHHLAIHPDIRALKGAVLIHPWFWGSEAVGEEPRDPAFRAMGAGLWFFACPGTSDMDDPRMNPMAPGAPALGTLACERVLVCAAEGDFLRWRGRAYAEAVAAARGGGLGVGTEEAGGGGGGVELLETEGEGHVFYLFKPDCDKAKEMLDKIVVFINAP